MDTTVNRCTARRAGTLLAALLFLVGPSPAEASRIRQLNLEEMTQRAAEVFSGRCVAVRTTLDPLLGREVTTATFETDRIAKGEVGSVRTIRVAAAAGQPRFVVGEEVVLFLYGESSLGLTSPVGFGQGKFSVAQDKTGRRVAINGAYNARLLRGLTPAAAARIDEPASDGPTGPIDPGRLLDMAEALGAREP